MGNSIKVAIIGVGNCASSLVQGIEKYRGSRGGGRGRRASCIRSWASTRSVTSRSWRRSTSTRPRSGLDLSEGDSRRAEQYGEVLPTWPHTGITVQRGMTHDGIGHYVSDMVKKAPGGTADISGTLQEREVDVVINYLPVGSEEATRWYAEQVLAAKVGFINCIPVFIASGENDYWQKRFRDAGAPIIGDDIKSQVGADDRASHVGPFVHGQGRPTGQHVPAQLRWQHGLPEHAGARPAD